MKLQFTYDWLASFQNLDNSTRKQILAKLKELERAESWPHIGLKGDRFRGLFKLRIGDYRLVYQVRDGKVLDFLFLGHRRDVYK